jgi:hypothetical protein
VLGQGRLPPEYTTNRLSWAFWCQLERLLCCITWLNEWAGHGNELLEPQAARTRCSQLVGGEHTRGQRRSVEPAEHHERQSPATRYLTLRGESKLFFGVETFVACGVWHMLQL